ncbi:MAG: rod shape-determining protein MreD [Gammaproteobacteria bacterium]
MPSNNRPTFFIYVLSIFAAMMLRIAPLPAGLHSFNPDWVLLVLIYWILNATDRIGVFNAFAVGLLTDALTGRLLGQYALAYSLTGYLCIKQRNRLRHFPVFQQGLLIFFLLLISQSLLFWTENIQGPTLLQEAFLLPVVSGTVCWPFIYSLLHYFRFRQKKK